MAYYSRFRMLAELSDTSDYAKAEFSEEEDTETTATQKRYRDVVEADTGGTTYGLGHLATCLWLTIKNLDTANKVTATLRTTANGATTFLVDIAAGKSIKMRDLRASGGAVQDITLTATTASVKCRISYEGT